MIPIGRAFAVPGVEWVSFAMARQMGKTNGAIFSPIGWRLDDDPCPILYVGPTETNINDVVEPKITAMIRECASLKAKAAVGQKSRKHAKLISGVILRFGWAGSDTSLKADSAGMAFVDEVDGIEGDRKSAGEGTVVDMVDAVISTFPDGKLGLSSTPTLGHVDAKRHEVTGMEHWQPSTEVTSAIWNYWQQGSRHEWAWPCPECRAYFIPRSKYLLPIEGTTAKIARDTGHLGCPNCGAEIYTESKAWMNARGVMVAPGQKPDDYKDEMGSVEDGGEFILRDFSETRKLKAVKIPFGNFRLTHETSTTHASFHVSGLANFSPKKTFGFLASKLVEAKQSNEPERLQGVHNTNFGELYQIKGDAPDWEHVKACADRYRLGQVPDQVTTLTAGVDVQKRRLIWIVRGWAPKMEHQSWLVDRGEIWGDTDGPEVWDRLATDILNADFSGLKINVMAVDSGYRKTEVYDFCKKYASAVPIKGWTKRDIPFQAAPIEVLVNGRKKKTGQQLWHLDTSVGKSWVHARIRWPESELGRWYVPQDIDDEYCKQIVAESQIITKSNQTTWIQTRKDNHALDCEVYAYFAMRIKGIAQNRPQIPKKEKSGPKKKLSSGFGSDEWVL